MSTLEKELNELVDYLNENYNQDSDNYNIIFGSKPGIIEYNDHIVISLWACGAIACIYDQIFFISEDDGNWWINSEEKEYGKFGYQDSFSIGWAESFINAMSELKKYVWEHGNPVYYSGTREQIICHYRLGKNNK